jgi:hypothetical protein
MLDGCNGLRPSSPRGAVVHPHLVADFRRLIGLSCSRRVKHYAERRQGTDFLRESREESSNGFLIHRTAAILGQHINDLLPLRLVTAPLLGALSQQIRATDHRGRSSHRRASHIHLRLRPAETTTGALSRALAPAAGSIRILELVSTTLESVATTSRGTLINSTGAIGAPCLGRSGAGGESGTGAGAVRFKCRLIWLFRVRHFRRRQAALLERSELFE